MDHLVGRITQLTNEERTPFLPPKRSDAPISKSQLIDGLKRYLEDYELTEEDDAMQKVIDWFINCTPGYKDKK